MSARKKSSNKLDVLFLQTHNIEEYKTSCINVNKMYLRKYVGLCISKLNTFFYFIV